MQNKQKCIVNNALSQNVLRLIFVKGKKYLLDIKEKCTTFLLTKIVVLTEFVFKYEYKYMPLYFFSSENSSSPV